MCVSLHLHRTHRSKPQPMFCFYLGCVLLSAHMHYTVWPACRHMLCQLLSHYHVRMMLLACLHKGWYNFLISYARRYDESHFLFTAPDGACACSFMLASIAGSTVTILLAGCLDIGVVGPRGCVLLQRCDSHLALAFALSN